MSLEDAQREAEAALASLGRAMQPVISGLIKTAEASTGQAAAASNAAKASTNASRQTSTAGREAVEQAGKVVAEGARGTIKTLTDVISRFSLGVDPFNDAMEGLKGLVGVGATDAVRQLMQSASKAADAMDTKVSKGAVPLLGSMLGVAGTAAGAAAGALDVFVAQLTAHADSFKSITRSGVVLADGMTGMARLANESGLGNVKQFALAVEGARPHIENLGASGGEAAARVAKSMGDLRRGSERFGERLNSLGYDIKDQGELIAMSMSMNRAAGADYAAQQKDGAKQAFELGKNMRLLSDLTGKDAKSAMEKARQESMRSRVLSTLQGEQVKAYQSATAAGSKTLNQALTEALGPAGRITSQNLLTLNAQLPAFGEEVERIKGMVQAGANQEDITKAVTESQNRLNQASLEFSRTAGGQNFILAGTVDNANQRVTAVQESLDEFLSKGLISPKQIQESQDRTNALANNQDRLTKAVSEITENAIAAQRSIADTMFKPTRAFADGVAVVTKGLDSLSGAINKVIEKIGAKVDITAYEGLPARTRTPSIGEAVSGMGEAARRETGGTVAEGRPYEVGERGREVFVPKQTGTVVPNDRLSVGDTAFQNELKSLMREQVMVAKSNMDVSKNLLEVITNLERSQSRFYSSTA